MVTVGFIPSHYNKKAINGGNGMAEVISVGDVIGTQYTKDGDPKGFLRYRIQGKVVVKGKVCQLNGYITQIKGQ